MQAAGRIPGMIAGLLVLAGPALAGPAIAAKGPEPAPALAPRPAETPDLAAILSWREAISPELRGEIARRCDALAATDAPADAAEFCRMFRVAPGGLRLR